MSFRPIRPRDLRPGDVVRSVFAPRPRVLLSIVRESVHGSPHIVVLVCLTADGETMGWYYDIDEGAVELEVLR